MSYAGQRNADGVKKGQKYQNKESFKAHRNIKRAEKDVTQETTLKNKACIGVCRRCVQKVRRWGWRTAEKSQNNEIK